MGDEHEVAAPHLLGVPADVLLLLRLQIVGLPDGIAVGLRRQALGLVKADGGYVLRIGQLRTQQGQLLTLTDGFWSVHSSTVPGGPSA